MCRSRRSPARSSSASGSSAPCSDYRELPDSMSAVLDRRAALLPGRFEFLMGLYAENYHRLARLFAPQAGAGALCLGCGRWAGRASAGAGAPSLHDGAGADLRPCWMHRPACARLRRNCACIPMRTWPRRCIAIPGDICGRCWGRFLRRIRVFQHRLRMNGFLSRWLEYLAEQGHSIGTLEPERRASRRADGRRITEAIDEAAAMSRQQKTRARRAFVLVAERTGLEPATSGVTGQHSNQLNYRSTFSSSFKQRSHCCDCGSNLASPRGFEPRSPP